MKMSGRPLLVLVLFLFTHIKIQKGSRDLKIFRRQSSHNVPFLGPPIVEVFYANQELFPADLDILSQELTPVSGIGITKEIKKKRVGKDVILPSFFHLLSSFETVGVC